MEMYKFHVIKTDGQLPATAGLQSGHRHALQQQSAVRRVRRSLSECRRALEGPLCAAAADAGRTLPGGGGTARGRDRCGHRLRRCCECSCSPRSDGRRRSLTALLLTLSLQNSLLFSNSFTLSESC